MLNLIIAIIIAVTIIGIATIISLSCGKYYSSENKRKLITVEEQYRNLENLIRFKDTEYERVIRNKEAECLRMADIIRSLTEKQQKYTVDANIKS